jgi:uncharacterized protein YndB with AHSA1/START domain
MNNFQFTTPGKDFLITCIYDAPRDLVWKTWTDAEELAQWFGPKIFTNRCEIDLKPGGSYNITMVSPDGIDYPISGTYLEIIEPEKLVMKVSCDEHPQEWHDMVNQNRETKDTNLPDMIWTITFEEESGKTKLTIRLQFAKASDRDALLKLGMKDGWAESLEKLEQLLPKMISGSAPNWVKKWEQ